MPNSRDRMTASELMGGEPVVSTHMLDVPVDRLPITTITLEDYRRLGGIPVRAQPEGTIHGQESLTGAVASHDGSFAYNRTPGGRLLPEHEVPGNG